MWSFLKQPLLCWHEECVQPLIQICWEYTYTYLSSTFILLWRPLAAIFLSAIFVHSDHWPFMPTWAQPKSGRASQASSKLVNISGDRCLPEELLATRLGWVAGQRSAWLMASQCVRSICSCCYHNCLLADVVMTPVMHSQLIALRPHDWTATTTAFIWT